jgi:hypothetical protein
MRRLALATALLLLTVAFGSPSWAQGRDINAGIDRIERAERQFDRANPELGTSHSRSAPTSEIRRATKDADERKRSQSGVGSVPAGQPFR